MNNYNFTECGVPCVEDTMCYLECDYNPLCAPDPDCNILVEDVMRFFRHLGIGIGSAVFVILFLFLCFCCCLCMCLCACADNCKGEEKKRKWGNCNGKGKDGEDCDDDFDCKDVKTFLQNLSTVVKYNAEKVRADADPNSKMDGKPEIGLLVPEPGHAV